MRILLLSWNYPPRLGGIENWPLLDSLDHSMWDFICYNVCTWGRTNAKRGIGYRPYLDYIKRMQAADRPLVILEYGASVSPVTLDEYGYGGWTEQEQAEGSIGMLRDILAAGPAGGTYTHFADQIWKTGSHAARDDDPEEWFGMLEQDLLSSTRF